MTKLLTIILGSIVIALLHREKTVGSGDHTYKSSFKNGIIKLKRIKKY